MRYLALTDDELARLLSEDVPCGDLTTATSGIGGCAAHLVFRARGAMVVCAIEEAARLFMLAGAMVVLHAQSGQSAVKDDLLLEARGSAEALHRAWKTAQVLVEWASGISTATASIVHAASSVPVACTRKNVPGTKALSVKAVRAGGAIMHRLGLSESLLLFHEHRLFLDEDPASTVARIRRAEPEKKLVVEVGSVDQAIIWAKAGAEVLQLEKFTVDELVECRNRLGRAGLRVVLAAAGGINAINAADYVRAGADMLVSSAPFSAPPMDVQVIFYKSETPR